MDESGQFVRLPVSTYIEMMRLAVEGLRRSVVSSMLQFQSALSGGIMPTPSTLQWPQQEPRVPPIAQGVARAMPTFSCFNSVVQFVKWMHKPPPGHTGLSVIEREFTYRDHGLVNPDIAWRSAPEVRKSARKRFYEFKKVYDWIQEFKTEYGARGLPGGGLTDMAAAEKLDQERVESKLKFSTWANRLCKSNTTKRVKAADVEAQGSDADGSGGA
jgi:hypothetical protein